MKTEWISVNERMPAISKQVFVGWQGDSAMTKAFWNGANWWSNGNLLASNPPTHWMPLPEPPPKQEPDAFETFCKKHFCSQSEEVMIIPDGKGAHYTVGKHTARYIWVAAVLASVNTEQQKREKRDLAYLEYIRQPTDIITSLVQKNPEFFGGELGDNCIAVAANKLTQLVQEWKG